MKHQRSPRPGVEYRYARLPLITCQSFFAIPLFDWQASSQRGIVGQYFWTYWAFAIPLAVLVLSIWAVWIRVISKKYEKEDKTMRAKSSLGLVCDKESY